MKKYLLYGLVMLLSLESFAQTLSKNLIKYSVTYDKTTNFYSVWIVPQYNTPNENNSLTTERGATAQVTLSLPMKFILKDITDVKGVWQKEPIELGQGIKIGDKVQSYPASYGINAAYKYVVIGKNSTETDYGPFKAGVPVELFKFKSGNTTCLGLVSVITVNHPIVKAADEVYSLGVEPSFYSQSGQPTSGNQSPLEQFGGVEGVGVGCIEAKADEFRMTGSEAATFNVLDNDLLNAEPVKAGQVVIEISRQPANGQATVKADGTISYQPKSGFTGKDCFIYQICSGVTKSLCDTAGICINVRSATAQSDLAIKKIVSQTQASLGDVLTYRVVVKNNGPADALDIEVTDTEPPFSELVEGSRQFTKGVFTKPLWKIASLAVGDSAVLQYRVKITQIGTINTTARVASAAQPDPIPTNNEIMATTLVVTILSTNEVAARWEGHMATQVVSFPNPVSHEYISLKMYSQVARPTARVVVIAGNGQLTDLGTVSLQSGENAIRLSTSKLPSGTYVLKLIAPDYSWTGRFIKTDL